MVRRSFPRLIALMILASAACAAVAAGPMVETTFDPSSVAIDAHGEYARLWIPGTATVKTPGAPALPVKYFHFVIPGDSRVAEVVVSSVEEEAIPGKYKVMPAQQEVPIGETPVWVDPDPVIYSGGEYPSTRVRYLGDGFLGGYRIASVAVHPLTYDPLSGELTLATDVSFELALAPAENWAQPRHRMTVNSDRLYRELVEGMVENPEDVAGKLGSSVEIVGDVGPDGFNPRYSPSLDGSAVEYVIITNDEYESDFQELADWKTKKGVPTVVRTISWINANYPGGCDPSERIRLFLKDAFTSWGTTFARMAGDTSVVPTRYAWSGYYGGWHISTDLYYTDLDGNWNGDGDSNFGEAYVSIAAPGDSTDLYPDMWVGRAPVVSPLEVETFIDKTLAYEKDPVRHFCDRNLYLAEVLFPYDWEPGEFISTDGAEHIVEPTMHLVPDNINAVRLYQNYEPYPGSYPLNREAAIDSLNRGYNITSHVGHGNKDILRVGRQNYITVQDADALVNGIDKSGLMWMLNCSSTAIEYDCISEHFMNNPDGGCAFLYGPTRFCFPTTAEDYYYTWWELLYSEGMTQAGVVSASCKIPYIPASFYDNTDRWTQLSFVFLGDPEVALWTGYPEDLTVTHDPSIILGPVDLTVTVTDPGAVEGALICIAKEDEVYAVGTTDGSGQAQLSFTPKTTGTMTITVTAGDHLPYESTIGIASSPTPHVTLRDVVVDDDDSGWSDGNGNAAAEAGEAIELDVTFGNGGQSQATGVTATLLDGDPYITLIDDTHFLGNIPALQEQTYQDAFLISIADTCPNGYEAELTLIMTDAARTTWDDAFVLRVHRPKLVQRYNDIDDGLGGNGVPNVGETVTLTIDVLNEGNGQADAVTGVLQYPTADVTISDDTDTWGDIPPAATVTGQGGFVFTVDSVITEPFVLVLTDEDGKEWSHSFDVVPPMGLVGLRGSVKATAISLSWEPSEELDLWGYNVYRTDHPAGTYELANDGVVERTSYFQDAGLDENKLYYYRVAAIDASGNEGQTSETLEISTNPPAQQGWPLLGGEAMYGTPAVADIDIDGDLEVIVGSGDVYCWHHDGVEYMDGDGDPRTNGVFTVDGLGGYRSSVAVGEMDGDPYPEFVAASWGNFGDSENPDFRVFAWNADDGTLLDGWPVSTPKFCWATAALGDLSGDGLDDVIIPCANGFVYAWDSAGTELLDGDGNPQTDGVFTWLGAEWAYGSPILVDIDNDLDLEIFVGSRNDSVYAWNPDGTRVPGWPAWAGSGDPGGVVGSPCAADVDNDGDIEIIVIANDIQLIVFDASGDTLEGYWPVQVDVGGDFPPSPTVADLDGDGLLEIIQPDEDGLVHVFNWDGSLFGGGWPRAMEQGGRSSASIGDVDGDGEPDVVVGCNSGKLYAYTADGTLIAGWPIQTDAEIFSSPTIADLDDDGDVEVLVSVMDATVNIWDCEGIYAGGDNVLWGTWRHDNNRHGYVGYEAPVGIGDGEIGQLRLSLEQNVPNPFNPVTTIAYNVPADVSEIELEVYNVNGRRVRTLVEGTADPGRHTVVWNGRNDDGEPIASGIYFVRLTAESRSSTRKVVLLK